MASFPLSTLFSWTLTILPAILSLASCLYLAIRYYRDRRGRDRNAWPRAEATIRSAAVEPVRAGDRVEWRVRVSYSFAVDGNVYGWFATRSVATEAQGIEYARSVKGRQFPVRYQPANPDISFVSGEEWDASLPFPQLAGENR